MYFLFSGECIHKLSSSVKPLLLLLDELNRDNIEGLIKLFKSIVFDSAPTFSAISFNLSEQNALRLKALFEPLLNDLVAK